MHFIILKEHVVITNASLLPHRMLVLKFKPVLRQELTVESFSISASDAPREARPIS